MKLIVNDVNFSYSSKKNLEDISFTASKGRLLGIIGQNGCGKTTLLKCIDRMLKPSQGSILIEEPDASIFNKNRTDVDMSQVNIADLKRKELGRAIGVVSQSSYVSFPFTGYDAVMMGRYSRLSGNSKKDREAVLSAMKRAGAIEFAERSVNELSGGELRRVMIARALAQEPSVLLLDEPTLHLDVNHQFDLMNLVTVLKKDFNMIVIMVTHDLMFASRFCDDILLMEKGKIVAAGKTEEVLTRENINSIFGIDAIVEYDERVQGYNVVMIGPSKPHAPDAESDVR